VVREQHDVGRLDVPVQDPQPVGRAQAPDQPHPDVQGLLPGQRLAQLIQALTAEQLGDHERVVVHLADA